MCNFSSRERSQLKMQEIRTAIRFCSVGNVDDIAGALVGKEEVSVLRMPKRKNWRMRL